MNGGVKSRLTGVKPINYCYEDTPSLCVEVNLTGALIRGSDRQSNKEFELEF